MRLGIDTGGTKTAALVLDDSGEVVTHVAGRSGHGMATLTTAVEIAAVV